MLDIHELATDLARDPGFWPQLVARTAMLKLGRAVFYALRYAHRHLNTDIPSEVLREIGVWGPPAPLVAAMDHAIAAAFLPAVPPNLWNRAALQALYIRSHWIKMPPRMLAKHLWTKYRMRRAPAADAPL